MKSRIISASDTKQLIKALLELKENDRISEISSKKSIDEVDLYIDEINNELKYLSTIMKQGHQLLFGIYKNGCGTIHHGRYTFARNMRHDFDWVAYIPDVETDAMPQYQKLLDCLLELQQQKRQLAKTDIMKNTLIQNNFVNQMNKSIKLMLTKHNQSKTINPESKESLDEEKQSSALEETTLNELCLDKENQSIKEAQDAVALQALNAYQELADELKSTRDNLTAVQKKESEEATLLETTRADNLKLQNECTTLNLAKSELDHLKAENEGKANAHHINRNMLVNILNLFDKKTSFFSTNPSDDKTLANLIKLSQQEKPTITINEIEACCSDAFHLEIFQHPYYRQELPRAGKVLRELGLLFINPNVFPKPVA